jgi:hypothetical protein
MPQESNERMTLNPRAKRRRKADPPPPRPFQDVITKKLISPEEGRILWDTYVIILGKLMGSFFSGCHWFVPMWDAQYDLYDSFRERSPFATNAIFAVAARIRANGGELIRNIS